MELKEKLNKIGIIILIIIISIIVGILIGFTFGRKSLDIKEVIKIEKLPEILISNPLINEPIVITPDNPKLPDKVLKELIVYIDTTKSLIIYITDTLKVYYDYISVKQYKDQIMFDNEYGKYTISYDILFNELQRFYNAKLQPNQLVKERIIIDEYIPFVEAGYSTADYIVTGGGIIFNKKKFGLRYNYQYDLDRSIKRDGHLITVLKTF